MKDIDHESLTVILSCAGIAVRDWSNDACNDMQASFNRWRGRKPRVGAAWAHKLPSGDFLFIVRSREQDVWRGDRWTNGGYITHYEYEWCIGLVLRRAGLNRKVPLPFFFLCHPHSLDYVDKQRRT